MTHFSTEDWVDYARQVDSGSKRAALQQHLDEGCSKCLKTLELWRQVVNLTTQQSGFEPPERAIRMAQASFALRKLAPFPTGKLELAALFFDSAAQPATAGVRGSCAFRQLLYKSGSVCIDMCMQPRPGSDSIILMGQLLDSAKPGQGIGGVPVSLMSEGRTLSSDKTNAVGEFDFGVDVFSRLQLVFGMEQSRTIVVPVPDGESR
jgi:hypothetical protein